MITTENSRANVFHCVFPDSSKKSSKPVVSDSKELFTDSSDPINIQKKVKNFEEN